MYLLNKGPTS